MRLVLLLLISFLLNTICVNCEDTFRKWITSDAQLNSGNSWMFAEYLPNYDNDTIFVWGGVKTRRIYKYIISNDKISVYDTLTLHSYAYSKNSFYIKHIRT